MIGLRLMVLSAVLLIVALAAAIGWLAWEGLTAIIDFITG